MLVNHHFPDRMQTQTGRPSSRQQSPTYTSTRTDQRTMKEDTDELKPHGNYCLHVALGRIEIASRWPFSNPSRVFVCGPPHKVGATDSKLHCGEKAPSDFVHCRPGSRCAMPLWHQPAHTSTCMDYALTGEGAPRRPKRPPKRSEVRTGSKHRYKFKTAIICQTP